MATSVFFSRQAAAAALMLLAMLSAAALPALADTAVIAAAMAPALVRKTAKLDGASRLTCVLDAQGRPADVVIITPQRKRSAFCGYKAPPGAPAPASFDLDSPVVRVAQVPVAAGSASATFIMFTTAMNRTFACGAAAGALAKPPSGGAAGKGRALSSLRVSCTRGGALVTIDSATSKPYAGGPKGGEPAYVKIVMQVPANASAAINQTAGGSGPKPSASARKAAEAALQSLDAFLEAALAAIAKAVGGNCSAAVAPELSPATDTAVFTATITGCGAAAANAAAAAALRRAAEASAERACGGGKLSKFCGLYSPSKLCLADGMAAYNSTPCQPSVVTTKLSAGASSCTINGDAWCIKNIPPKPVGAKEVTLDAVLDTATNDTPAAFVDQFCAAEANKAACRAAFLFCEDRGVGPSAWNTWVFDAGANNWGISDTQVCTNEATVELYRTTFSAPLSDNAKSQLAAWKYSQDPSVGCADAACQDAAPRVIQAMYDAYVDSVKPLLLLQVRVVGLQAFQLDLAQTYSIAVAYDRVFYSNTMPPLAPKATAPAAATSGFWGILGNTLLSFGTSASASWKYILPFFSGPAVDGIAAIFRLTQRMIIPLIEAAGEGVKADDPTNWNPVKNPLLDQQAQITFAKDKLIGAHKTQTAALIQAQRNVTWTILLSAKARRQVSLLAETGTGSEAILRGNSVFSMYCSIDASKPSDLFTVYNTTIYYNTLKALMPVRYRVCAESRVVCESAPMQKCIQGSDCRSGCWTQTYNCYDTNVCFGKAISNRIWPANDTAYDTRAPYTGVSSWGDPSRNTYNGKGGEGKCDYSNVGLDNEDCNIRAYDSCQRFRRLTSSSYEPQSNSEDLWSAWLCDFQSQDDPNKNAIPTKDLTNEIEKLLLGFSTNGSTSMQPVAPGLAPGQPATIKDLVQPWVVRGPRGAGGKGNYTADSYFTNNILGWNFTVWRFPTGDTLSGQESRELAAGFIHGMEAKDAFFAKGCCGDMPGCSQNPWTNYSNPIPSGTRIVTRQRTYKSTGTSGEVHVYVSCPPETTSLLSCGFVAPESQKRDPGVYFFARVEWLPGAHQLGCQCGKFDKLTWQDGTCYATCGAGPTTEKNTLDDREGQMNRGTVRVECANPGDRVTGCGFINLDAWERYPTAMPSEDNACTCYHGAGKGACRAFCWRGNADTKLANYSREVTYDKGPYITAKCSDPESVAVGCGIDVIGLRWPSGVTAPPVYNGTASLGGGYVAPGPNGTLNGTVGIDGPIVADKWAANPGWYVDPSDPRQCKCVGYNAGNKVGCWAVCARMPYPDGP